MIIDNQKINIKITHRNIKFYKNKGYKDAELDSIITIEPKDLPLGSHIKVDVKCDYCNSIVKVVYKDYVKYKFDKYSCVHCRQRKTSEYNLHQRQENIYQKIIQFCTKNNYKLLTPKTDILTIDSKIQYECPKHGIHEVVAKVLIYGDHKCPKCAIESNTLKMRKSPNEVYNDFQKYNGTLLNKEEYLKCDYKNLKVICNNCGEIFTTSYLSFMKHQGQRCPECSSSISKGEYSIKQFLEKCNINYIMQYRFSDCKSVNTLPFDFYLPSFHTVIEYDGEGHYMPIKRGSLSDEQAQQMLNDIIKRDKIKNAYCTKNKINIIRIAYWDYNNITTILTKELFT